MAFRILVVDDTPENITALTESLADSEIDFVIANSGHEALKHLSYHQDIDLALVDVQMPGMDGFELAQLIRGVEKTRHIPVIFITALSRSYDFEFKGYNLGAVDIIFKPVNLQILKTKVDVFKRLREKRLKLDQKIFELEMTKKDLEISEKKAIDADKFKSAFLANMSHEIRTPMTALIGFAELLRNMLVNNNLGKEYVEIIIRNGNHLIDLVSEILDLSKVEAGQLNMEMSSISLSQILTDVLKLLEPIAKKNNIKIKLDYSAEIPSGLQSDSARLKQILTNVIGNAIKFSPNGAIEVKATLANKSSHKPVVKISVKDTGMGIDPERSHLLFQPFSQLAPNPTGLIAGTGLGLCLSKKMSNLLGGDLYLEQSTLNQGSTFVIEIPVTLDSMTPELSFEPPDKKVSFDKTTLNGLKILLADDSLDNQMLIETVLGNYGAVVYSVNDGNEAVSYVENNQVDLVLMDFKMPHLDGLGATQVLRAKGYSLPVLLVTANAMKGEKDIALKAGADGYVSKPID